MTRMLQRFGPALLTRILLCGCEDAARIQVLEAVTKTPVADVVVKWTQLSYPTFINPRTRTGQLSITDGASFVELRGINLRSGSHTLEFSKTGYATTYVIFSPHVDNVEIRSGVGQQTANSQAVTNLVNWTNVLVIPLARLP